MLTERSGVSVVFPRDSTIRTRQEGLRRTIDVIARTVELNPESLELTTQNRAQFLAGGQASVRS